MFVGRGEALLLSTHTDTLSPQPLQELRDPTLTFRLLCSPRYGGRGRLQVWRGGVRGLGNPSQFFH